MRLLRGIAVAFSMYSRIPMPIFEWKDEDMSNGLVFFPLVGVIIGAISFGTYYILAPCEIPLIVMGLLLGLIPIAVTGGFHIDGFMDVTDALRSYQPKEKKLEILKDPHIGAFAVIGLVKIMLTYGIGLYLMLVHCDIKVAICYGLIFVISRAVSGLSAVVLPKAKKDGMLYEETKHNNKSAIVILSIWMIIAGVTLVYINWIYGAAIIVMQLIVFLFYRHTTNKQFGGVTGDTAGYLVTVSETWMVVILGIAVWVIR